MAASSAATSPAAAAATQSRAASAMRSQRVVVERRQRVARGARLQERAQLVDLGEVVEAQLGHEVAAPWQVGQLALLLEHAQRLAHRRDAEPDLLGEVLLVDALARLQRAGDDRPAQRLDGVLLRGPGTGGCALAAVAHRKAWIPVSAPPTTSAWTSAVPS